MAKAAKAWHIVHYCEMLKAIGNNGTELETVAYSQRPIAGNNEHRQLFLQRMAALEQTQSTVDFLYAAKLYDRMLDLSQIYKGRLKICRGFVLDENMRPAGPGRIGQMVGLGLTAKTCEKYLKILQRVGLIERAQVPEIPADDDGTPAKKTKKTSQKTGAKAGKKSTAKSGKKAAGGSKSKKKNQSGNQVDIGPPAFLKGEEEVLQPSASDKSKEKIKSKSEPEGTAAAAPLRSGKGQTERTAVAVQAEGKDDLKGESEVQAEDQHTGQRQGATARTSETPSSPATAPLNLNLNDLTGTEAGGDGMRNADHPTPSDVYLPDFLPKEKSNITETDLERLYDRTGYVFAETVCREIGTPQADMKPTIEAFAAAWQRAMDAGLNVGALNKLFEVTVKRARYHGNRRRRGKRYTNSPEATCMYEFNQRMAGKDPFANARNKRTKSL